MANMNKLLGQLFIIGFPGENPSPSFLQFIAEEHIGGVILFEENCGTYENVRDNIQKIKEASEQQFPFIAIDQEGGRVSRLHGSPAEIASARTYGESLGLEKFEEDYTRSMYFLESLGINLNFAPVCDLFVNEKNSCLEGRCFGNSPEMVIPFIKTAVEASKKSKIISCLKHFPGLGDCAIDPHKETAYGYFEHQLWQQREAKVFQAGIDAGADMVMTTHMKLPRFDKQIATGSDVIVKDILRHQLAFEGTIITDDLTMKGADELGDIGERTIKAFLAGHDLLLFGQNIDAAIEAYERFRGAILNGEISEERLHSSLERISSLKFKVARSVLF